LQFSQVRINKFVLIIVIFKNQVCGNDYLTGAQRGAVQRQSVDCCAKEHFAKAGAETNVDHGKFSTR